MRNPLLVHPMISPNWNSIHPSRVRRDCTWSHLLSSPMILESVVGASRILTRGWFTSRRPISSTGALAISTAGTGEAEFADLLLWRARLVRRALRILRLRRELITGRSAIVVPDCVMTGAELRVPVVLTTVGVLLAGVYDTPPPPHVLTGWISGMTLMVRIAVAILPVVSTFV